MPASTADVRRLALTLGALALLLLAGCASDPPDPAEVRLGQVRDRLEATFSDAQADCIVDALDDATIRALAADEDLAADDEQFTQYSNVVLLCSRDAVDPSEVTTTTTG